MRKPGSKLRAPTFLRWVHPLAGGGIFRAFDPSHSAITPYNSQNLSAARKLLPEGHSSKGVFGIRGTNLPTIALLQWESYPIETIDLVFCRIALCNKGVFDRKTVATRAFLSQVASFSLHAIIFLVPYRRNAHRQLHRHRPKPTYSVPKHPLSAEGWNSLLNGKAP